MPTVWGREPVLFIAFVTAVINVAVVFGVDLSTDQKSALLAVVNAVAALTARSAVTPVPPAP